MSRLRSSSTLLLVALACKTAEPPQAAAPVAPAVPATIAQAPDQWLTRPDGVRLRYRVAGQGTPVVLLHGYTLRIELMLDLADSLSGASQVIVLDQRGFGESTKLKDPARYGHAFGDDVIALLDSLHIPRANLVGHSMGAAIAADVALRYPSRVSSVSLVAGPFYRDSAAWERQGRPFVRALEHGAGLKPFVLWIFPGIPDSVATEFNRQGMAANDSSSLVASLKAMSALVVPKGARPDSTIRVLIAVGTRDPLLPRSRELKALWPRARLVEVKDANHDQIRANGATVAAIREAIRN